MTTSFKTIEELIGFQMFSASICKHLERFIATRLSCKLLKTATLET